MYSTRIQHIALHLKLLEELVKSGIIIVTHKSTEHILAHVFTKYLGIVVLRNIMAHTKEYRR